MNKIQIWIAEKLGIIKHIEIMWETIKIKDEKIEELKNQIKNLKTQLIYERNKNNGI